MRTCSTCGGNGRVIETRRTYDGRQRRRMVCQGCGERWTEWEPTIAPKPRQHHNSRRRVLSDGQLGELLTTRLQVPATELAREWGISPHPILQARRGRAYMDRLPGVRRPGVVSDVSCHACIQWRGEYCGLGFPEARMEGASFALDCSVYRTL